jgi:hypothetical protein
MGYDIVSLIPAFCAAFLGSSDFEEGGMVLRDQINVPAMDYSVSSLHEVDRYLEAVHEVQDQIPNQTYTNTVLATGCYVGEVIRRNGKKEYRWVNYADYFPQNPSLMAMFPEDLGTGAVLVTTDGKAMLAPFNKVIKFIEDGSADSVHFFATGYAADSD